MAELISKKDADAIGAAVGRNLSAILASVDWAELDRVVQAAGITAGQYEQIGYVFGKMLSAVYHAGMQAGPDMAQVFARERDVDGAGGR